MILILLAILLFLFLVGGTLFLIRREQVSRKMLETKLNHLNAQLKKAFDDLEETRARLETTFSGMVEGVLLTDQQGDILHLNPTFREMFGLRGPVEGRSALEVLASVACDDAIQKVIREEKPVEREVLFEKPKRRVFKVHFSPMHRDGRLFGVVSVFHDLTEIRRLEEVRRDFIANLSHEIKTPLTAIRGFSETLLEDFTSHPEESRKHLEVIFRHAAELAHLMENLLNLSRLESGKEEVLLESISLRPFVERLLERFSVQAKVKQIQVSNEVPENAPVLEADPGKLNQILGNLLDNALKYTPEGGKVWVRAEAAEGDRHQKGGQAPPIHRIELGDTGPGIPKEDQERIFERFYRVDKARSRDSGGSGLGLAIVKHLVELHGGRVTVESSPGQGSLFKVFLPQPLAVTR